MRAPIPAVVSQQWHRWQAIETARSTKITLAVVAAVLTILKLWLIQGQLLTAWGQALHDDMLFISLAAAIRDGHWLGPYNNLTLAKGPIYPLWLALSSLTGLSVLLTQQMLYALAALVLTAALLPLLRTPLAATVCYVILLYNPVSWQFWRILREGIYPALTMLVMSGLFGAYLRRHQVGWQIWPWVGLFAVIFPLFWLTREEGLWIIPIVGGLLLLTMVALWRRLWWTAVSALLVPIVCFGLVSGAISTVNRSYYGAAITTEFAGTNYVAAYRVLVRVEPAHWIDHIPVPEATRQDLYRVSPAFAELASYLEGELGHRWQAYSCDRLLSNSCQDLSGGTFMWTLRDAVAAAGYYRSATAAEQYYHRLALEVQAACDQHAIACSAPMPGLLPPWINRYAPVLLQTVLHGIVTVVHYDNIRTVGSASNGSPHQRALFQQITHAPFAPDASVGALAPSQWGLRIRTLNLITFVYQWLTPLSAIIAIAGMIQSVRRWRRLWYRTLLVSVLICISAMILRVGLVSYTEVTSFRAIGVNYLSPVYPLMLIGILLGLLGLRPGEAVADTTVTTKA